MLELHSILWVIPGFIFIYLYNKLRPTQQIQLSGWPYVFLLVVIASITWLPAEMFAEWLAKVFAFESDFKQLGTLIISVIISLFLLYFSFYKSVAKWIYPPITDNFYEKCIEWENQNVILTLKSGKAYRGVLWKYPKNPDSRSELQAISIIPLKSGYRAETTKELIWDTVYPNYEENFDLSKMEIIFPRSEVISFRKYSGKAFEFFESKKA